MSELSRCVTCGRPAKVGVLHDPLGSYTHYCLQHEPEGTDDYPVNNQLDDLDEVTHD
jgi:hypothetical protein